MGIRYGRVSKSGQVRWFDVSHCECDGIGGFARLLREQGAEIAKLPETKHPCRSVIRPLWRRWLDREKGGVRAVRGDWLPSTPSENVAWHLFTKDETREIIHRCRALGVTVNSGLLHCLDRTVRREIRAPRKKTTWLIPVNLRGDIRHADDTRNHVSCVEVAIAADDSAQAIHRQTLRRLERGEHRANHLLLTLGGILSHRAKVGILTKGRAKPAGNIGSFSNLGVWNPGGETGDEDAWVFCPPVVGGQLLGAGCVTFHGRLGLATQGDSATQSATQRMDHWVDLLRKG